MFALAKNPLGACQLHMLHGNAGSQLPLNLSITFFEVYSTVSETRKRVFLLSIRNVKERPGRREKKRKGKIWQGPKLHSLEPRVAQGSRVQQSCVCMVLQIGEQPLRPCETE